jgi:hypothetical protein
LIEHQANQAVVASLPPAGSQRVGERPARPSEQQSPGCQDRAASPGFDRGEVSGFRPTLAHEKLTEVHHLGISRESVRRIMIEAGIWKPKRAKQPSAHQMRERRACFGELVQIDGSDHAWFEGRGPKCTLLVYIDDATGQLLELLFVPSEPFSATVKPPAITWSVTAAGGLL